MSVILRSTAHLISFVTHPLLLVTYMLLFLLAVNPFIFGVRSISAYTPYILMVAFSTILIPAIAVFMMRSLGLVKSVQLVNRTDRIGPLIVAIVFYSWLLINFYNNPMIPRLFVFVLMGATFAIILSFAVNVFVKLSIHAVGLTAVFVGMLFMSGMQEYGLMEMRLSEQTSLVFPMYALLAFALLLLGLAGTSRLYLGVHTIKEWILGMFIGATAQTIAYLILF